MNAIRYVEVNARDFIGNFVAGILANETLVKDLMEDENYVLRITSGAIEVAYPGDPVLLNNTPLQ